MRSQDLRKSTTVVEDYTKGVSSPLGNGFFISLHDHWYLVTCYHVFKELLIRQRDSIVKEEVIPTIALRLRRKKDDELQIYSLPLVDTQGVRIWRSCIDPASLWDVAIVELNHEDLLSFDVVAWTDDDFLSANTELMPNEVVSVLSNRWRVGMPFPHDFPAMIAGEETWPLAGADGGVITRGLCPGDSGALVYRIREAIVGEIKDVELVGVFTGAPMDVPSLGLFHFAKTIARIIEAEDDCWDEEGLAFDDGTKAINRSRRRKGLPPMVL